MARSSRMGAKLMAQTPAFRHHWPDRHYRTGTSAFIRVHPRLSLSLREYRISRGQSGFGEGEFYRG
jgi:hypothetical protein